MLGISEGWKASQKWNLCSTPFKTQETSPWKKGQKNWKSQSKWIEPRLPSPQWHGGCCTPEFTTAVIVYTTLGPQIPGHGTGKGSWGAFTPQGLYTADGCQGKDKQFFMGVATGRCSPPLPFIMSFPLLSPHPPSCDQPQGNSSADYKKKT